MNRITALILLLTLATLPATSQQAWPLQACIDYALQHNIALRQRHIALEQNIADWKHAKAALFPSLTASTGQSVMNRPFQSNSATVNGTEVISTTANTTYTGTYGLNLNWTLWNGGRNALAVKMSEKNKETAAMSVAEQENTLKENIVKTYMQALYAQEAANISKAAAEVSEQTLNRARKLLQQGALAKPDVAQLETARQTDLYNIVTAQNALNNYLLQLKQLLELTDTTRIVLVAPNGSDTLSAPLPTLQTVYEAALAQRPEIAGSKLSGDYATLALQQAKAGYLPTLSLNASTGTTTYSGSATAWGTQLKNGWNNMVGLTLSIPIFDNRTNKSNVEKARLNLDNARLDLLAKQKALYATVSTLWQDADNARAQYRAAQSKEQSSRETFDLVNEQFALGMKNTVELLTAKNSLLTARMELVQAKYTAWLNTALLHFYANQTISL